MTSVTQRSFGLSSTGGLLSMTQIIIRLVARKFGNVPFLTLVLFAYWLSGAIKRKTQTPLRVIPGPFLAPLSRIYALLNIMTGRQFNHYLNWHEKYGPFVRTGPRTVSITDPAAVKQIYGSHAFRKGRMYDTFAILGENMFSTRDPDFHRRRKRQMTPVYSQSTLNAIESLISSSGVEALMNKLERTCAQDEPANLFTEFMYMTFDVTGEIIFGRSFGLLRDNSHPILDWMSDFSQLSIIRLMFPLLYRVRLPGLFGRMFDSQRKLYEFTREALERRKREVDPRRDALQQLIECVDEETGEGMKDPEVIPEMIVQMVAGTDTTSITLSWCVYMLLKHPDIYQRLQAEVDEAVPERDNTVTYSQVNKLPILDAVLHETLRMFPPVADGLPRQVPKGGADVGGYHLPGGTIVFCSAYAMQRSSALWENPDSFVPDRWLVSGEKLTEMKKAFIPFSFGPRACIGRNLAWIELKLTLSTLLRRFSMEYVPGARMDPIYRFMLTPRDHRVDVRLKRRE